MNRNEIAQQRLYNQQITRAAFKNAREAVEWLVAVQAQDYYGSKWSLGLRMDAATDRDIERAFNAGHILRTHCLRPTWHFVSPADIRWLLALTAPRVHAANGHWYRRLGLDHASFKRSNAAMVKALEGGRQLTRDELRSALEEAGIKTEGLQRMAYLMMQAELEGVVCSGPRRGKQFTYALLDERAPGGVNLDRQEALVELSRRFFQSRGPATEYDFAKWSGLTVADARLGLEAVRSQFQHELLDGRTYWFPESSPFPLPTSPAAHLLSIYDEFISSYKGLDTIAGPDYGPQLALKLNALGNALTYIILIDGLIVGNWKRTIRKDTVMIETNPFKKLSEAENRAVAQAARKYGEFLELRVSMV